MKPEGVLSGQPLVYSKASPGFNTGCSPTTPGPFTSSSLPRASVIFQCRFKSCTVSLPRFSMRTLYAQTYLSSAGEDCSSMKTGRTVTVMLAVVSENMALEWARPPGSRVAQEFRVHSGRVQPRGRTRRHADPFAPHGHAGPNSPGALLKWGG